MVFCLCSFDPVHHLYIYYSIGHFLWIGRLWSIMIHHVALYFTTCIMISTFNVKKADLGKYIIIILLDEIYSSKLWKASICHPVMPETMSQYVKVNF